MSDWLDDEKITLKSKSIDLLTKHWIAEGERIATERIIKLLEELAYFDETGGEMISEYKVYLIALIKGEK